MNPFFSCPCNECNSCNCCHSDLSCGQICCQPGPPGPMGPAGPTGPAGPAGTTTVSDLLSAYSTPSAPGTSGSPLKFDLNGATIGTNITHTAGSTDFTISAPGTYYVAFHGNVAPASGVTFPLSVLLSLQLNGTDVPGAFAQHTFTAAGTNATMSFSFPVQVTAVPATLRVMAQGGNFLYSGVSLTIIKLA